MHAFIISDGVCFSITEKKHSTCMSSSRDNQDIRCDAVDEENHATGKIMVDCMYFCFEVVN